MLPASAVGSPIRRIFPSVAGCIRSLFKLSAMPGVFFTSSHVVITALKAWQITVAIAAPAAPIFSTATKRRSSTMFNAQQAMST